jgi:hypothetical protein
MERRAFGFTRWAWRVLFIFDSSASRHPSRSQPTMQATAPQIQQAASRISATHFVIRVGGRDLAVRGFPLSPIHELLGFEEEFENMTGDAADPGLVADMLESRMIDPPRPRRRRDRAVSSRAAFYAPAG